MKHTILALALGRGVAGSAAGAEIYVCDRTRLSTEGFTTKRVAETWYPAQMWFEISGATVARGYWGAGTVAPDGDRLLLTMPVDGASMKVRFFPSQMRATVWLNTGPRYVATQTSSYRCTRRQ